MAVPSSLASLSQTPGSNSPAGSDTVFPSLDDYLREIFADLARLRDGAQHILTSVSGTDTITASCAQISTFAAGQMFAFVSAGSNATTTVTLNINSLGAKSILRPGGGAMAVGDIPASGVVFVGYNGTNFEHLNSRHASTADSATSNAVDAAYFMALLTGNPLLQFDTNDYIWYDRTNNKMGFSVGGTDRLTVDATGGPQRSTDASTSNGLVRKSQMDAADAKLALGGFRALVVSATGTSSSISVGADALLLLDGSGGAVLATPSLTINSAASGVNGLDTGSLAANTWYSVWVIHDGTNTAGLLSLSASAPTMPGGYTYKARVGWIRTDSTGNKYPLGFTQSGRRVQWRVAAGSNLTVWPSMATAQSWGAVGVSAFVPPTASRIRVQCQMLGDTQSFSAGSNSSTSSITIAVGCGSGANYATATITDEIQLESSNIYFASNAYGIRSIGWEDNL